MLPAMRTTTLSTRQIMTTDEVRRALVRIGHEIVEKHGGTEGLALVGIERRGPILANRIAGVIAAKYGTTLPVASVETTRFRDDRGGSLDPDAVSAIPTPRPFPFELPRSTVVLVDDVLFTGRTVRAAMDALVDRGRPAAVRLAVLIDRGHRELPIRADHVGKNVPTARDELVEVVLEEFDSSPDAVRLISPPDQP
jgi:pyrimidine operon attenuation protein/uracil phosphoribosyltransferase